MPRLDARETVHLARRAVKGWIDDGAATMGASVAFYTLFSLAPLLLVAIGLAGFFVGHDEAQAALIGQVSSLIGDQAAMGVEDLLDRASTWEQGVIPAIIGIATLVFGATTVFAELRADLDRIWRHKPRAQGGLMKLASARFFSFLLVAAIGMLLLFSLVATSFLANMGTYLFGKSQAVAWLVEFTTSFVVVTLLFAMIYKILPSTRLAWRDVWMGAAFTSLLFWVGKFLIALYIAHAGVSSSFGAAGTVVLLIVWVYYSAQIFFLGAEFTREFALRHGSKRDEQRLRRPLSEMRAANDASIVDRARDIVRGRDRFLNGALWRRRET